jgi:predicted transcriptional regulator
MARRVPLGNPPSEQEEAQLKDLMSTTKIYIGESLHRLRQEQNVSLRQLSMRADLNPYFISEVERGRREASLYSLIRLTRALNSDIRAILPNDI